MGRIAELFDTWVRDNQTLGELERVMEYEHDHLTQLCEEQGREAHCMDCCCAQSWNALGITEYTGKNIPEHISGIKSALSQARAEAERLNERLNETPSSFRPDWAGYGQHQKEMDELLALSPGCRRSE